MNTITLTHLVIHKDTLSELQRALSSKTATRDLTLTYRQGYPVGDLDQTLALSGAFVSRVDTVMDLQQIPKDENYVRLVKLEIDWSFGGRVS